MYKNKTILNTHKVASSATLLAVLLCLLILTFTSKAQDAKADFKKINIMYNTSDNLAFDIKYELFFDASPTPYETETGKYIKQKNSYYTKQAEKELVVTDEYYIMVDKEAKIVALDKKTEDFKLVNPLSLNLDSLYMMYTKIEVIPSANANIRTYKFNINQGPYSVCIVSFNIKTNFVTEIKNIFRDKLPDENNKEHVAVLKTTFTQLTNTASLAYMLNSNTYITKLNKKFALAINYKTYKFINHLN